MAGKSDYYKPGDNNVICDVCAEKFKASQLRRRWDGAMVCDADWEPRQPQDFVRGIREQVVPAIVRPDPAPTFITNFCTLQGRSSIADYAVADCATADLIPEGLTYVP